MTPKILVTGGTGTLGRQVDARLLDRGAAVRILSRGEHASRADTEYVRGDLATGEGLAAAVTGVDTVVHCASSRTGDAGAARNLMHVAAASSVSHVVYISIVGSDVITMGYYRAKVEAERAIVESGLPWTTLRATQFFELLLKGAKPMSRLPVIPVPAGFRTQPVDSAEVAARLTDLALSEPAGRAADLGGPEVLSFAEVIRTYLAAVGKRRPVVPVWLPGTAAVRAGGLLVAGQPGDRPPSGQRTWAEFLAARPS
jgi:uncharacterized protein YbjT (DUF2867 family)